MIKKIIIMLSFCGISLCCLPQAYMHITTGTSIKLTSGVVVNLNNTNLIVDGNLQQSAGDGTFMFSGGTGTSISGSSLPIFDKLVIATGTGNKLSLQHDVNVVSQVGFTSGLLDLNNNNLNLGTTGMLVGESENSRIIGPLGGKVISTATLNAPSLMNPGNLGALFTSSQDLGLTTISRGHQSQPIGGSGASILRYFDIAPTNDVSLNATLRQQYFDSELNGFGSNSLQVWSSSDNINWTNLGLTDRDTSLHYVDLTGISSFSRWTLSSSTGIPLPLTYIFFNASCASGQVNIQWETALQFNTKIFDVERSGNGSQWQVIGSIQAAGNSAIENSYSFTDNNPLPGNNEYRIAEYDLDGRPNYSQVIISPCGMGDIFTVWPNPVTNTVWLSISTANNSKVDIRLYDARGVIVLLKETDLPAGNNQFSLNLANLAQGTYELMVDWGTDHHASSKIIKL
jgi:Secretion system C-terminal sorting domain